ncbi:MAG: hypothetical protein GX576_08075 [Thauera phenolivorans]|uniref:Uncharacterized protein n=1 Tax=Thauera phenolivorans TaxID=1792543 RepID=A0A7X7LWU1_9RHOO|nr:hypothetical protein [Thauera phenolivorans]NLF54336.1 hypothetical protein [Thauera phenolivorans]
MELRIERVLTGLGLFAGLLFGTGHAGGGVAVVVAGMAMAWMQRVGDPDHDGQ